MFIISIHIIKTICKKIISNIFYPGILLFPLISCTQPLIINYISADEPGYFMYGKREQRNFFEKYFLSDSLQKLWQRETKGSQLNNSPVIFKNNLFVADLSGRIYGYDKNTGKEIGYEKNNGAISTSPVINKLRLFYVVNNVKERFSTFIMFDFVKGKKLNEMKIDGGVNNELIRSEDALFVLSDNGELIRFNYAGEKEWSVNTKTTTKCIPAADDKYIVWGNQKGEIIFADPTNGKIIFKQIVCEGIESGVTIDNHVLYFGDIKGNIIAFDMNKKSIIWSYKTNAKIKTIPVFNDNDLFVGNLAGNIYSVNKTTGKRNWVYETNGIINTTPLLVKNMLIQPDYNKKVYLINSLTGITQRIMNFERRVKLTPLYYDGILYLGSDRGQIHAYKTIEMK